MRPSQLGPPSIKPNEQRYCPATPLPAALVNHCTICIEEQLFTQAFALFSNAVTSGECGHNNDNDNSRGGTASAQVAPPSLLGLIATVAVHPRLTTRATPAETLTAADEALRYLRLVNSTVGPRSARFNEAFVFLSSTGPSCRGQRAQSRRTRGQQQQHGSVNSDERDNSDNGDGVPNIRSRYADRDSLWTKAEDFCALLGWALNCSVAHKPRWRRWVLFLDLLLDILTEDLEQCVLDAEGQAEHVGVASRSLLVEYLSPVATGGRNSKRRLMRALVADGTQRSLAEFPEIWPNETRPPRAKRDERLTKRRKLDIDHGDFGDYVGNDSDQDGSSRQRSRAASRERTEPRPREREENEEWEAEDDDDDDDDDDGDVEHKAHSNSTDRQDQSSDGAETFGGMESIGIRQRLIALLNRLALLDHKAIFGTDELFDLLTEFIRPLPLPVFQHFVLPTKLYLQPAYHASLNQMLLNPLLSGTAPNWRPGALTQAIFESHYAPRAAIQTHAIDNARVSLLTEGLLRYLRTTSSLKATSDLKMAVEKGLSARSDKVAFDGRRKKGIRAKQDDEALVVLGCSAERLIASLDLI